MPRKVALLGWGIQSGKRKKKARAESNISSARNFPASQKRISPLSLPTHQHNFKPSITEKARLVLRFVGFKVGFCDSYQSGNWEAGKFRAKRVLGAWVI